MINFKAEFKEGLKTADGGLLLTFITKARNISDKSILLLEGAKNGLNINISNYHLKRSLDANAYLWTIIDKIADKLSTTKELVYKELVKRVGVSEIMPIRTCAVERFIDNWQSRGLGWLAESLGQSKLPGYTNIIVYFGTSTYNTKEMARIIEECISEAKELGISTISQEELDKLANEWGVK